MNEHVANPTWSDPDAAVAFLKSLRPTGPWNVTAIVPDVSGAESATFTNPEKARTWIADRSGRANLYFMPNPAPRPSGASGRANKVDVPSAHFVHVDLDLDKLPEGHELHPLSLADRKAHVAAQLAAMPDPGPPSTVVDTGGGLQALWPLDPPLADIGLAERLNEHMLATLPGGDPGTHNVDRLLRLPGTINLPDAKKRGRGRTKAPARLVGTSAASYADIEFDAAPARVRAEVDILFDAPVFTDDLAELNLPDRIATIVRDGRLPERKKGDDSRSSWLFDAVCGLLRHGVPDEVVLGLLLDSRWGIADSVLDHGEHDKVRYAEHQVRQAHGVIMGDAASDFDDDIEPEVVRAPKPSRFQRYRLTDLMKLDPPEWLVSKMIPAGGLVQLYGARKRNKTFVALDLCLCIAIGRPFHGVPVKRGKVTYVIGEGGAARFGDRVLAWCRHNKVSPAELDEWFEVVPVRVGVDNKTDLRDFLAGDDQPTVLVVFDTLARSMDGDENSTQDMNRAVAGLDMVREHYKGAVLVVHHSGKDEDKKGRGSTVLPGAVDATLKVYKDAVGKTVLSVEEIRDAEAGLELRFQPVSVIVADDLRSSLVMRHIDDTIVSEPQTGEDRVLVEIVERGGVDSRDELVDKDVKGMSRSNVSAAISMLKGKKLVVVNGAKVTATAEGVEMAMLMGAAVPEETTEEG